MIDSKRVLIIAGPNGAGKTVFATEFLPKRLAAQFHQCRPHSGGSQPIQSGVYFFACR